LVAQGLWVSNTPTAVLYSLETPLAAQRWILGSVAAFEWMLFANALIWACEGLLIAGSTVFSRAARRTHPLCDQLVVTARLGLFTSVGAFLVAFMVGLAVLQRLVYTLVDELPYQPFYYLPLGGSCASIAVFLEQRAASSAASLAAIAALLLGLIGFIGIVFAPSVLTEIRAIRAPRSAALGAWLTQGYRSIEVHVRVWGIVVAVAVVAIVALLGLRQAERWDWLSAGDVAWLGWLYATQEIVIDASRAWLAPWLLTIATGTVGLLSLGRLALRGAQALRAPLDAALDVDNHFREFPRAAISRVRIMERYLAVLRLVQAQNYERVVIVAHSQGTVITAELLRYLRWRSDQPSRSGTDELLRSLRHWIDQSRLRLLTVGSPLRQLYALRFPDMYSWVLSSAEADAQRPAQGPLPSELGVCHWRNLWGSGDYVGRWLWSGPAPDGVVAALATDEVSYALHALAGVDRAGSTWTDTCIGGDAHTHYFDLDQKTVAATLRSLVLDSEEALAESVARLRALRPGAQDG
jgi:hypothetical protein